MTPYWLLFAIFAFGAALSPGGQRDGKTSELTLGFFAIVTALMIGLRYHVGADYRTYEEIFTLAGRAPFVRMLQFGDPGYQLLNWVVSRLGGAIWQVNLVCALLFCWGLLRLVRQQPEPWLAMVIAIPYLVIVVAMGYTRQAVAIGFVMAGLAAIHRGASTLQFAAFVAAAALFHKTAVVALPLVIFAGKRNAVLNFVLVSSLTVLFYYFFLEQSVGLLIRNYLGSGYSSQGAEIRVALNLVPAILFLANRKRFKFGDHEKGVYQYLSLVALIFPIALMISPSSTAVDRMALYIIPLQIVILGRAGLAFGIPDLGRVLIISYSAAILFTWLSYAKHAKYWLPYQIYPIA